MAWSSLSTRIDNLPLVIAGPILRRTEKSNVSVWLALKEDAGAMTLNIYNGVGATPVMSSPPTNAVKLGDKFFVVLLTAKGNTNLSAGVNYEYDISFSGGTWANKTLANPGILNEQDVPTGGIHFITYAGTGVERPSFALPPSSVDDLRIIHASCRKPHGGELDALRGLDDCCCNQCISPTTGRTSYTSPATRFMPTM